MAIYTDEQIRKIITDNPQKGLVQKGRDLALSLARHVDGVGLTQYLQQVRTMETKTMHELRQLYVRTNKDLVHRTVKPTEKVYTASGGSNNYQLPEKQERTARQLVANLVGGMGAKEWVKNYWNGHLLRDPNGFVFIELARKEDMAYLKEKGQSWAYPTYKSIHCIYDFGPNGDRPKYIVFHATSEEKIAFGHNNTRLFRFVDDARDVYVELIDGAAVIKHDTQLPNPWGQVPAMQISSVPNLVTPHLKCGLLDGAIELLDEYLIDGSIKRISLFQHGFPRYWEVGGSCGTCADDSGISTGKLNGQPCPACGGSKKSWMKGPSDIKLFDQPTTKDDPVVPPNVAGFVVPPADFFEMATTGLSELANLIYQTVWGVNPNQKAVGGSMAIGGEAKTATEVMTDQQPMMATLETISSMAESRIKFIIDTVVSVQVQPNYRGCSYHLGRRYLMEPADAVWNRYQTARVAGASAALLDTMLIDFYNAQFQTSPLQLERALKLMKVEPFVHLTAVEAKSLGLPQPDWLQKVYFGEWLGTVNEAMVLSMSAGMLRENLADYATKKQNEMLKAADPDVTVPANN